MTEFTPYSALLGGALIGLAATALLLFNGRIAGITGIAGGLLGGRPGDRAWRVAFLAGLVLGGTGLALAAPQALAFELTRSPAAIVGAGLLVGFGTRLGGGCTSGHGVCGISRLSTRSLVATGAFMATGFLAASVLTGGVA
ncbi:MAG: YeeE/YedE family protein [Myxococcales bacterium]|nr:YeeE/YedE family protein [Myxococcales bacterium]